MINFGLSRMLLEQGTRFKENRKITNGNKVEMKLLIGLKFKVGFVPIFSFSLLVSRACSPCLLDFS